MRKIQINVPALLPVFILAGMAVIFGIATEGALFSGTNLMNLFNQSTAVIIAGLGMIFAAAMGGTDITHGAICVMASTFACLAASKLGAGITIPVYLLTGLLSGLFVGTINARFHAPSFMVTLACLISYRAASTWILSITGYILFPDSLKFFNDNIFRLCAVVILALIIGFVFHYTAFGTYVCSIGENETAVKFTGVNITKIKIAAFMLSGLMASIAAIFTAARVGSVEAQMGSGFEMKVMMAMFIGGIPVQGGMKTKLYKLILGAPTIMLLENGLVLCGAAGGITQLIRGLILLGAVFFTQYMNTKLEGFGEREAMNSALADEL